MSWDLAPLALPEDDAGHAVWCSRVSDQLDSLGAGLESLGPRQLARRWTDIDRLDADVVALAMHAHAMLGLDGQDDAWMRRVRPVISARNAVHGQAQAVMRALADEPFEALCSALDADRSRMQRAKRRRDPTPSELIRGMRAMQAEASAGWCDLQRRHLSSLRVPLGPDPLSLAQLNLRLLSDDPQVRLEAYAARAAALRTIRDPVANALSHHHSGQHRIARAGGQDRLGSALRRSGTTRRTVEAMWQGVGALLPSLRRYLRSKAVRLGHPVLPYGLLDLPVSPSTELDVEAGWTRVSTALEPIGGTLHGTIERARAERWVHASPSDTKRGAFCLGFPATAGASGPSRDTARVLLTWAGSGGVYTLAHELGHAWHHTLQQGLPVSCRANPTHLAEAASNFVEHLVRAEGRDAEALDAELSGLVMQLMSMQVVFVLEAAMDARGGPFDAQWLDDACAAAFETVFEGSVADPPIDLWVRLPHLYKPGVAYYNWSYAFGALFSRSLAAALPRIGIGSVESLLRQTGIEDVQTLGRSVGIDVESPDFWESAAEGLDGLVDRFGESV